MGGIRCFATGHDGVNLPVMFTSRAFNPNEVYNGAVEKEVLALLQMLDICYTLSDSRDFEVLTRYSTLAWLMHSSGLNRRLGRWAALLSTWTLEISRCNKGEDEILGTLAACITPRKDMDEMLITIEPRKQPRQTISTPIPTIRRGEVLLVVSFDGSTRIKEKGGAYSAVKWKLPEWTILSAASRFDTGLTVNEAEYHGFLLNCDLLVKQTRGRVVICGDSNLVIRQMQDEIDCKAQDHNYCVSKP